MTEKIQMLLRLGWRNLWRQRRRSFLVIAAACVGMLGVLMTVGLMKGLRTMWVDGAIESGLGHVQVRPLGYSKSRKSNLVFTQPNLVTEKIKKAQLPAEVIYTNRFERTGFLRLGTTLQGVTVVGIDFKREIAISKFDEWLIDGKYLGPTSAKDKQFGIVPCLLGKANADKFEVELGDTIILSIAGENGITASKKLRIVGIFQSIAEPVDKYTLLLKREDLSLMFNQGKDNLSYSILRSSNMQRANELKNHLAKGLQKAEVLTYKELQPAITGLLEFSDSAMSIFYLIMLSGFAFVLMNSILMSVYERTREIGILLALGSRPRLILWQVVFESIILGFLGAIVGSLVGSVLVIILNFTGISLAAFAAGMEMFGGAGTMVYVSLRPQDITTGLIMVVVISFLASFYPAVKAIRLSPIDAIYNR